MREIYFTQHIEMSVFRHDELGSCGDGAIHELIVIRVFRNQSKPECRIHKQCVPTVEYHVDYQRSKLMACIPFKYFFVFIQHFVGYAENALACQD